MIQDEKLEDLLDLAGLVAREVGKTKEGMDVAFGAEQEAERELLLDWLEEIRPALSMLADCKGPVLGLRNGRTELRQVVIDTYKRDGERGDWLVVDHDELGLVIAKRPANATATLVWPGGELPTRGEGGPRLACVLEHLADRLVRHAMGSAPRRRQESVAQRERIKAIQTLLRSR